jgi:hypothetical protein
MGLDGVETRELAKLHGLLIAMDWVELKSGQITVLIPGAVPACYRVTGAGLRALRHLHVADSGAEPDEVMVPVDKATPVPKPPRRKLERLAGDVVAAPASAVTCSPALSLPR